MCKVSTEWLYSALRTGYPLVKFGFNLCRLFQPGGKVRHERPTSAASNLKPEANCSILLASYDLCPYCYFAYNTLMEKNCKFQRENS